MVTAKFGSKNFEVKSDKIYTPNGVSLSEELNLEEIEVSGKKPTVNIKGVKLQDLSFDVKLDCRFVDVWDEISFWKKTLLAKKPAIFKLGAQILGRYYLYKMDTKQIVIGKKGVYISAVISLSFKEDGAYTNKTTTTSSTTAKKVTTVKASTTTTAKKVRKGSTIKPKSGTRWYYTAEGALKKSGKSGKAYQSNLTCSYTYSKSGKIVCVNPQGLGWMKIEDVMVVKY